MTHATVQIDKNVYTPVNFGPPDDPLEITQWGCGLCSSYHYNGKFYAYIDVQCTAHAHVLNTEGVRA